MAGVDPMDKPDLESPMLSERRTSVDETSPLPSVEFDNVRQAIIGSSMKYQIVQSCMCVSCYLPFTFALFNFVFIGYEPPHVCAKTNETELLDKYSMLNDTTAKIVYETCRIKITSSKTGVQTDVSSTECVSGHSYQGGKDVSIKSEWDLVCDRDGIGELVQTTFKLGMAISLTLSGLADRFGRKPLFFILIIINTVFEFCIIFSPSVYVVIALKFLSGIAIGNTSSIGYLLGTELLITRQREIFAMASLIFWSLCITSIGGIAYALRSHSWRFLQLLSSLTGLLPLIFVYFIYESLPWLFAKGQHSKAVKIIKKACATNNAPFDDAERAYNECCLRLKRLEEIQDLHAPRPSAELYGFRDIFRHRGLWVTTLILCLAMFTHSTTYYGIFLTSATFHVNRFYMFIILAGLEIPATVGFFILLTYIGRRTLVLIFLSSTAVCLLVSACLTALGSSSDHIRNVSVAFFILGKFSIDMSYGCLSSFLVDHFPTTLRSIGNGLCVCVARIGGMASPFLYPLYVVVNWAPGIILMIICFVTVAFYKQIPETKGRELPTTIDGQASPAMVKSGMKKRQRSG